jgi:hypothetical protein
MLDVLLKSAVRGLRCSLDGLSGTGLQRVRRLQGVDVLRRRGRRLLDDRGDVLPLTPFEDEESREEEDQEGDRNERPPLGLSRGRGIAHEPILVDDQEKRKQESPPAAI